MTMLQLVLDLLFLLTWIVTCTANGGCHNPCVTAVGIQESCSYKEIGQKCYYKFYNMTTWQENKDFCEGQGLEMVQLSKETIPHMAQLKFDAKYNDPDSCYSGLWLAGRAVDKLVFVNDTDVKETPLSIAGSAHTMGTDKSCGFLSQEDFTLKLGRCWDKKYFLCRFDDNHCLAFNVNKTWFEAREKCLESGGDLFYLKKDDLDLENIKKIAITALSAANITTDDFFHIGAASRVWMWPGDSQITASNWKKAEPNDNREQCLMLYSSGEWNDHYCTTLFPSFCQGDLSESLNQQPVNASVVEHEVTKRMTVKDECYHLCLDTTKYHEKPKCLYTRTSGQCYYLFKGTATWLENQKLCRDQALEMVQLSKESNPHINSLLFTNPTTMERACLNRYVWLGGKAKNLNKWSFLNHQDVIPTFYTTEPKDYHKCGYMYMVTGNYVLKTGSCYDRKYFLCRHDQNNLEAFKEEQTWFEAREKCLRDGGDLFYTYPSEKIVEAVFSALENKSIALGENFHVGLVHRIWQWQNEAQIVSSNWENGEPNDHSEGCLEARTTLGIWNDLPCERKLGTFCQRKLASPPSPQEEEGAQKTTTPSNAAGDTTPGQIAIQALLGVFSFGFVVLLAYNLIRLCQRRNEEHKTVDCNAATELDHVYQPLRQ